MKVLLIFINLILLFSCQRNTKNKIVEYYQNGNKKIEYHLDENGTGEVYKYYENGIIKSKSIKKNNKLNGEFTYFYPNGKLKFKRNYVHGVENGQYVKYFLNNSIKFKFDVQNGKIDGQWVHYDSLTGIVELIENYKEDKREGELLRYNSKGNLYEKSYFKNDNINGKSYIYTYDGKIRLLANYEDGTANKYLFFNESGILKEYKGVNKLLSFSDSILLDSLNYNPDWKSQIKSMKESEGNFTHN